MKLEENSSAFDLLAFLCSVFTKEKERECAEMRSTVVKETVQKVVEQYKNLIALVLNASANEYRFNSEEIQCINDYLQKIDENCKKNTAEFGQLYFLTIEIEHCIERFANWQGRGVVFPIAPLNSNYNETNIYIYPHYPPAWNVDKSERKRSRTFNAKFENHVMIRKDDVSPFEISMNYWNDEGLLQRTDNGWKLKVALSPVMDYAQIDAEKVEDEYGKSKRVNGIKNKEEVEERVLRIFDAVFEKQYGIIVFPEMLGSEDVLEAIKEKMRMHPEIYSFVLLPTICGSERNVLVILGPGGVELMHKDKGTAFIEEDEYGESYRERLQYNNQIELLITKELGNIAFPICAELLEPMYYSKMMEEGHADFIITPSFSPGYQAFIKTLKKGEAAMTLGLWVNCCSAKNVSRNGKVPEVLAAVQIPTNTNDDECVQQIKPQCDFACSDEICYFDITIVYQNKRFYVQFEHCICA